MFKEIAFRDISENLTKSIAEEWMLITAGNETDGYNMMTASWGFTGEMWGADAVVAAVRPQRYTMDFIDKNDYFSLSFYGENKDIHKICGSMSGRDVNKTELTGLTPVFEKNTTYFEQARLVIICKKQYVQGMREDSFIDREQLNWYKDNDYHNMIVGKVEKVLVKV